MAPQELTGNRQMPKKKEPPLGAEEQRKRFEELAKKSGAGASTADVQAILKRIARPDGHKPKK